MSVRTSGVSGHPRQTITAIELQQRANQVSAQTSEVLKQAGIAAEASLEAGVDALSHAGGAAVNLTVDPATGKGAAASLVRGAAEGAHSAAHSVATAAGAVGVVSAVPVELGAAGASEVLEGLGRGLLKLSESASRVAGSGKSFTVKEQKGTGKLMHERAAEFTARQAEEAGRALHKMGNDFFVELPVHVGAAAWNSLQSVGNGALFVARGAEAAALAGAGPVVLATYDLSLRFAALSVEAAGAGVEISGDAMAAAGQAFLKASNALAQGEQKVESAELQDINTEFEARLVEMTKRLQAAKAH